MSKISVVLHDELYQQILKNDNSLSIDTFASMDFYTEVDNDAVLSKAIQLASTSKKVLFTRKNVDKLEWELREIGPINVGTFNVKVEHDLPKLDWMDEASPPDPSKLFGLRTGPTTASINGRMLGLVVPNFDDNSGGKIVKDEQKGGEA